MTKRKRWAMSALVTDEMVEAAHAVIDREIGAECPR